MHFGFMNITQYIAIETTVQSVVLHRLTTCQVIPILIYCFSSPPTYTFLETDKHTHTHDMYGMGTQRNAKANVCSMQTQRHSMQINGVECKWNGNFLINATVFNKDLISEQSGCSWLQLVQLCTVSKLMRQNGGHHMHVFFFLYVTCIT